MILQNPNAAPTTNQKRVTFSKYSTLSIYHCNSSYRCGKMSYSSFDQRVFKAEATRDALRIRVLITQFALHAKSTHLGSVIYHLMQLGLFSVEELLGLDKFISNNESQAHAHVAWVVSAHKQMKEKNEECAATLAQTAMASSSRSIQNALCRASLAMF